MPFCGRLPLELQVQSLGRVGLCGVGVWHNSPKCDYVDTASQNGDTTRIGIVMVDPPRTPHFWISNVQVRVYRKIPHISLHSQSVAKREVSSS